MERKHKTPFYNSSFSKNFRKYGIIFSHKI